MSPWDTLEDDLGDVKIPERPLSTEPQTSADSDGLPSTSSSTSGVDQERSFFVLKEMFPEDHWHNHCSQCAAWRHWISILFFSIILLPCNRECGSSRTAIVL